MKRRNILLIGVLAFIITDIGSDKGCMLERYYKLRSARVRVETVLKGITLRKDGRGTIGDEQLAICRWWSNTFVIGDLEELNRATTAFDMWRKSGGFTSYIDDYTITEIIIEGEDEEEEEYIEYQYEYEDEGEGEGEGEAEEEPEPMVFIIYGTINGGSFIMRAPEDDTITWLQPPW